MMAHRSFESPWKTGVYADNDATARLYVRWPFYDFNWPKQHKHDQNHPISPKNDWNRGGIYTIKITCRHFVALQIIDKIESFITFNVDLRHINKAVHQVCNQVFSQALCEWKASKEQEQPERRAERPVAQIFNLPRTASFSMFSLSFSGKTSSCTGNSPRTSRSTFPGLTDSITRRFTQEVIGRTE